MWEMNVESKGADKDNFIFMKANIMTKQNGVKRFKIYTELQSALMDEYHVIAFEETSESVI